MGALWFLFLVNRFLKISGLPISGISRNSESDIGNPRSIQIQKFNGNTLIFSSVVFWLISDIPVRVVRVDRVDRVNVVGVDRKSRVGKVGRVDKVDRIDWIDRVVRVVTYSR